MTAIHFDVLGQPAPQGSKSAIVVAGRARVLEGRTTAQRQAHAQWRHDVAQAAWVAMAREKRTSPLAGPVLVSVAFRLRPPKSLKQGVRLHHKRPDVDKLVRSVLDALVVGGVVGDDGQVAQLVALKRYAEPGEPLGAVVRVATLDPAGGGATPPYTSQGPFPDGGAA